ncbi:hypothetical protein [uncultured Cardiobacterium sp.]|uniref:hypothetical protein n=1 Tax=uncultured Cardiobacterium sp. TaxID=417619 RepID=UPI00262276CF|nr:hypothetical protein [uncultured Cardiobacterium sp.]
MKAIRPIRLRDIVLYAVALLFFSTTFAFALLGVDEAPASVRSEAHAHYIAELCPHLSADEQPGCLAWLRKGGRHE